MEYEKYVIVCNYNNRIKGSFDTFETAMLDLKFWYGAKKGETSSMFRGYFYEIKKIKFSYISL